MGPGTFQSPTRSKSVSSPLTSSHGLLFVIACFYNINWVMDLEIIDVDHLHKSKTPVLALAGDRDLICPPEAVYETAKLFPEQLVSYKLFGQPDGPHYAHYDLVGGSYEEREPGLAAVVTLASSLDYTTSKSSLKLLIPLADPAQALNARCYFRRILHRLLLKNL
ncbi:hypothetical protein Leryth_025338 [Lithospermum erythrorhizon]|nr:hypothetical protein Leryth_025338 [Lithospermum erythrorhizon]